MRVFLGMILGCLLTIGLVYVHDVRASSTVATSTTGVETRQLVNWDVASAKWNDVKEGARHTWARLKENVS